MALHKGVCHRPSVASVHETQIFKIVEKTHSVKSAMQHRLGIWFFCLGTAQNNGIAMVLLCQYREPH